MKKRDFSFEINCKKKKNLSLRKDEKKEVNWCVLEDKVDK